MSTTEKDGWRSGQCANVPLTTPEHSRRGSVVSRCGPVSGLASDAVEASAEPAFPCAWHSGCGGSGTRLPLRGQRRLGSSMHSCAPASRFTLSPIGVGAPVAILAARRVTPCACGRQSRWIKETRCVLARDSARRAGRRRDRCASCVGASCEAGANHGQKKRAGALARRGPFMRRRSLSRRRDPSGPSAPRRGPTGSPDGLPLSPFRR